MRSRRIERCSTCGLNGLLCLCSALPVLSAPVRIVVVAHRTELLKSTNSGRLAVRMLAGAELVTRASPIGAQAPASIEAASAGEGRFVLFPSEDALPLSVARARGLTTLVVPDGTWNQAKRMARRDPCCAGLAHVRLESEAPSNYRLRRNARADGLCTFEAIAGAMRELGDEAAARAMLAAFAQWVARATLVRAGAHDSEAARALASTEVSEWS